MSLPTEVRAKYTGIIDGILSTSDLTTISEKKIRKGIQEAVEYDITPQKASIKELIMERFDVFNERQNGPPAVASSAVPKTNGHIPQAMPKASPAKREATDTELSDVADTSPPKKKRKPSLDEDAKFAAALQAEEDARVRPTRGGGTNRKAAPKKKTPKKKSKAHVDDSDVDSDPKEKKPPSNTGFHKPHNLSPALSDLFGGITQLSRPQATKKIWEHIKANDLQNPADKREILCDESMKAVFKTDKIHMFKMTKAMNEHLYPADEV